MVDLHTHTKYSDGTDDVIPYLQKAENVGLKCISITDHDTVEAYMELKNIDIKKYYTGKIITGCEIFTLIDGTTIELLGYDIDTDIMEEELKSIVKYTVEEMDIYEAERIIEICLKSGIKIDKDILKKDFDGLFKNEILHREMRRYPENKKFFRW